MSNSTRARRAGAIRSHELAKYHRLPTPGVDSDSQPQAPACPRRPPSVSSSQASSPDTALTAYAQLTALRLNASRAMISVIDRETQYFIAESTKTLDLADTSRSEKEGDGLWLGCASVSAGGRLCEKTVELPVLPNGYPAFVVNDLSRDPRFNQLPFVTGPPFFKYYAGVPLTTNRGINIGSLFVIDDQVRPDLTQDQKVFMTVMSRNIMAHLELGREAEERRRGQTMSRGLARFVEGYPSLSDIGTGLGNVPKGLGSPGGETQTKEGYVNATKADSPERKTLSGMNGTRIQKPRSSDENQATGLNTPSGGDAVETTSSSSGSQTGRNHEEKDNSHRATFARAANLLRESLQLEGDGGVVYYDTSIGFSTPASIAETSSSGDDEQENEEKLSPGAFNDVYASRIHSFTSSIPPGTVGGRFERTAPILGFSTKTASSDKGDEDISGLNFSSLPEKALAILVKRYPRGKLWSFDVGILDSSSDDELSKYGNGTTKSPGLPEDRRAKRREAEAKLLLAHFPGVRQLLFTPMWDAGSARWYAGAFCFSFSNLIFSNESELSFCIAFGNCVMAEISRLNTIVSDQSKSDFIGSISHELRSPLHGILGSAEFLGETNCDTFQKSLVDTIDACGRTLLDTINHVLDFSKINSFEKNWRAAQKFRRGSTGTGTFRSQTKSTQPGGPALLNIYAQTDVAAVCEEVVEGVFTGHIYAGYSSLDITNVTAGARGKLSNRGLNTNNTLLGGQSAALEVDKKVQRVAVILDIKKHDWMFTTQPGALRRIIMNLFGNALKYTDHGWVRVSLEAEDAGGTQSNGTGAPDANAGMPTTVRLTVTDTGRGMSPDYLRTRLYTPFAQENNLAPGTGLGLSIVRSIVNMLGGSIDVRSELGKGTEVRLTLPMIRSQGSETPLSTPSSSSTVNRSQDDCITMLRDRAKNTRVALYGLNTNSQESNPSHSKSVQVHVEKTLSTYLTDWYGISVTQSSNLPSSADIVIVDEENLDAFHTAYPAAPGTRGGPALVCLCSNTTRYGQSCSWEGGSGIVEFISKPFGPYKLARALRSCLDKIKNPIQETKTSQVEVEYTEPSSDARIGGVTPEFERLTLETDDDKIQIEILDGGKVQANGESANAQLAIGIASTDGEDLADSQTEYPFPPFGDPLPRDETATMVSEERNFPRRKMVPPIPHIDANHTSAVSGRGETASTSKPSKESQPSGTEPRQEKLPPRILLVDDNKINLRLLQTYMRKRHYSLVDSADDGGEAVRAFAKSDGYDIIFMDISMPVLNGFEATRAIRQIEDKRQSMSPEISHRPALIIALTGLASGRDQSEAFTSGVDLFMTKPVSFKEVGRLLDNWEANGGT